jgi:YHS domain-containing protein
MRVDETETEHVTDYRGQRYYFCSEDCKRAFELAPEKYLQDADQRFLAEEQSGRR